MEGVATSSLNHRNLRLAVKLGPTWNRYTFIQSYLFYNCLSLATVWFSPEKNPTDEGLYILQGYCSGKRQSNQGLKVVLAADWWWGWCLRRCLGGMMLSHGSDNTPCHAKCFWPFRLWMPLVPWTMGCGLGRAMSFDGVSLKSLYGRWMLSEKYVIEISKFFTKFINRQFWLNRTSRSPFPFVQAHAVSWSPWHADTTRVAKYSTNIVMRNICICRRPDRQSYCYIERPANSFARGYAAPPSTSCWISTATCYLFDSKT